MIGKLVKWKKESTMHEIKRFWWPGDKAIHSVRTSSMSPMETSSRACRKFSVLSGPWGRFNTSSFRVLTPRNALSCLQSRMEISIKYSPSTSKHDTAGTLYVDTPLHNNRTWWLPMLSELSSVPPAPVLWRACEGNWENNQSIKFLSPPLHCELVSEN